MIINELRTIRAVLASWLGTFAQYLKDAGIFYYRLATNKYGLPRWLWMLVILGFVVLFAVIVAHDFR